MCVGRAEAWVGVGLLPHPCALVFEVGYEPALLVTAQPAWVAGGCLTFA